MYLLIWLDSIVSSTVRRSNPNIILDYHRGERLTHIPQNFAKWTIGHKVIASTCENAVLIHSFLHNRLTQQVLLPPYVFRAENMSLFIILWKHLGPSRQSAIKGHVFNFSGKRSSTRCSDVYNWKINVKWVQGFDSGQVRWCETETLAADRERWSVEWPFD